MPALATSFRRWLLPLLLLGSLGACQRAGYQLQAVESAVYPAIAPAPVAESAVITIALPPAAQPSPSHFPEAYRPRRRAARHPRHVKPALPLRRAAATASVAARAPQQRQEPTIGPVRYRSRVIAGLLAFLTFPFGLHNFYLGYYGRGAITVGLTIASTYLLLLGFLGGIFSSTGLVGWGLVGLAILIGCSAWQFSDLMRIITGDLKPKDGEYK